MAERFHVNWVPGPGTFDLTGDEAHHLAHVCRIRPGQAVCLFDGSGLEYPAIVRTIGKRQVSLDVMPGQKIDRESACRVIVASALPRGDRATFLVEKLTELGAARFVPLKTARSVVSPREGKLDKLHRHVIEACKQCGRNVLMDVEPLADFLPWCGRADLPAARLLAHPGGEPLPEPALAEVALAIGPEGGFTDEEVAQAVAAGWRLVSLGSRILRIETAALALAAWFCLAPRTGPTNTRLLGL